jgi:hypothetical protein
MDWLAGRGMDVFYFASPDHPAVLTRDGTYMYECLELAISLYSQLGYGTWTANGSTIQSAAEMITATLTHPPGFEDLSFYRSGEGDTPPRPGDLVVWDSPYNEGTGHVGVVSRVMGSRVELVQQNMWRGTEPRYRITLDLSRDDWGRYTLKARDDSAPTGWIHSPRMTQYLADAGQHLLLNSLGSWWNRDGDALYLYLTPRITRVLAGNSLYASQALASQTDQETTDTPLTSLTRALGHAGALGLTDLSYVQFALQYAVTQMRSDTRFFPSLGMQSVDVKIGYSGDRIWLRPWGGEKSGEWIEFDGLWGAMLATWAPPDGAENACPAGCYVPLLYKVF